MFVDRQHAGKLLAEQVLQYVNQREGFSPGTTLVIGLPRGGIPVAAEVALTLGCPLDLLVSKKIGAPDNPELAIGAVSSGGVVVLDEQICHWFGDPERWLQAQVAQKERLMRETRALEDQYIQRAGIRERPDIKGKLVIVADDGVATGMTTMAALRTLREKGAGELVLATPVIPHDTFKKMQHECDKLIALSVPYEFLAVGYHYQDFHQVSDEEMIASLRRALSGTVRK
ncbi:MAG TPA: phosphoribosyltransferase family protein [Candidatus Obscuribacterales bacterium]